MIKKTIDVDALNIEEIFDFEYKINKKINKIRKKQKQIDYIYLNYNKIKSKLDININQYKKLLIKINNKKEEYDMKSLSLKLQYLEKEYDFLIKQNNAKINTIKYLKKRILSILNDYKYNLNYDFDFVFEDKYYDFIIEGSISKRKNFYLSFSCSFLIIFKALRTLLCAVRILHPITFAISPKLSCSPKRRMTASLCSDDKKFKK